MHISSLPQFSALVKDYVANFDGSPVHEFFPVSPERTTEAIELWIAESLAGHARESRRATTVASIRQLHESLGIMSGGVEKNLELLASPTTFAVVTGQQVGILGGPLYTFYKAFTAIALARSYSERHPEWNFVPVFWLETEDHDIDEAIVTHVLDKDSNVSAVRYTPANYSDAQSWRKQVGSLPLEDDATTSLFAELTASLGHTEFTDSLVADLRRIYQPGTTFGHAFAKLLFQYFGNEGLLVIDGTDPELKRSATGLILKELETSPQLSEKIVLQSVKLEDHYHAQVKPRALNLFYVDSGSAGSGERLPIVEHEPSPHAEGRTFFLKGTRRTFTLEELTQLVRSSPERFSPNVVLRPLYQDWILPTAAYVAGPGEIAYFAQFAPGYEWASLPMPIVAPRVTVTLVEERLERILEKYGLDVSQVLTEGQALEEKILAGMLDVDLERSIATAVQQCEQALESVRDSVNATDPTLDAALTTLKGKVATTVRDFGGKVMAADRKRHATARQQLDRLFSALLPEDALQERELSLVYFLNKYGPTFPDRLKTLVAPLVEEIAEHHVLHLAAQESAQHRNLPEMAL
jgi:bacillithiol biosynthesis cysteine-adding enzyme BshC